jgi:hypothetical protein
MPVRTRTLHDYVTATRIRALTELGFSSLLRMVAAGDVRVQVVPGLYPLYCLPDVEKNLATRPGRQERKPNRSGRKPQAR